MARTKYPAPPCKMPYTRADGTQSEISHVFVWVDRVTPPERCACGQQTYEEFNKGRGNEGKV